MVLLITLRLAGVSVMAEEEWFWGPLGAGIDPLSGSDVIATTVYDGDLVVGGAFTHAGDEVVRCIARWDGEAWHPFGGGMSGRVKVVAVYDGDLIAGGYFTTAGGEACNCIARWDGGSWQPLGAGMDGGVEALLAKDGELFAGGHIHDGRRRDV